MAESEIQDLSTVTPQFSEAVATFLYDSLNDATKSLVVRLKTSKNESGDGSPDKEDSHTPAHSESSEGTMSLFNVPYTRNPNFVGRSAALSKLFAMWKPGNKGRIAIAGLGGIGYV